MSFKFGLRENPLNKTSVKNYIASPQHDASKTMDDIIDIMIGKGSTVTRAEAYSVIEEYNWAIEQILLQGGCINTPMFNIAPSITGTLKQKRRSLIKAGTRSISTSMQGHA